MYIVLFRNSYLIYLLNNNPKNVEFQLIDIFEDELYLKYTKDLNINVKVMLTEMDKEIQMNRDENH
jgi:CHASE3 domain sensor protein